MRHIVRAGAQVVEVASSGQYVELAASGLTAEGDSVVLLLPDEARDLAERLRGVADAIEEPQRQGIQNFRALRDGDPCDCCDFHQHKPQAAKADPRQMSLPLLTVEKGNG